MANFNEKKVYIEKINNLNKIIQDMLTEEIELKIKINENDNNADLVHMLFVQLSRSIATRVHLEKNRQGLMNKYLRVDSDDESGSGSDESESESD